MTSVKLCRGDSQFYYLAINILTPQTTIPTNLPPISTTYLITIDTKTGGIYHSGIPKIDLFDSFENALEFTERTVINPKWNNLGIVLFGATIINNKLYIGTVTDMEPCANLFEKTIYKIKAVKYEQVLIGDEVGNNETPDVLSFPLTENHYFCMGMNLNKIFPFPLYEISVSHFCWNQRWIEPFVKTRALQACITIFQGAAFSLNLDSSSRFNITYILKRSAANPGTRYAARGINSSNVPANECECSLIFKKNNIYHAISWRRGSSPLKWKTVLNSSFSSPKHIVEEEGIEMTPVYFSGLFSRFDVRKIHVVSLLNESADHGEFDLLNAYKDGVKKSSEVISNKEIEFHQFDINKYLKFGSKETMDEFIKQIIDDVENITFTKCDNLLNIESKQNILFRFNCADSLDRTNLATFYYALLITSKYGYENNIFKNDDFNNWHEPTQFLTQDVIDFIGNSFISSGDIVSFLYTNTEAIKTSNVRQFMSNITGSKGDITISLQRRFKNVFSDPQRQRIIEKWTSIHKLKQIFTIDEIHYSPFFREISSNKCQGILNLIKNDIQPFKISKEVGNYLNVMFPEMFLLRSVSIYLYPQKIESRPFLSILCGNNICEMYPFFGKIKLPTVTKPQWIKYDLKYVEKYSSQFPTSPYSLQAVKFVSLRFDYNQKESFIIGNVRFEVQWPNPQKNVITIFEQTRNYNSFNIMNEIVPKNRGLCNGELQAIEICRLNNGVSERSRNDYLIRMNINPYFYDFQSQIMSKQKNICPICGAKIDGNKFKYFNSIPNYKPIIARSSKQNSKSIEICDDCAELLNFDPNVIDPNGLGIYYVIINKGSKMLPFSFQHYKDGDFSISKFAQFFSYPTSLQSDTVNSVFNELSNKRLSVKCKLNTNIFFGINFPYFVKSKTMTLILEEPCNFNLNILTPFGKSISRLIRNTQTQFIYDITIEEPVQSLFLVFSSISSENQILSLKYIDIIGRFYEKPEIDYKFPMPLPDISFPKFIETECVWDASNRKQIFSLSNVPTGFVIKTSQTDNAHPISLIISTLKDTKFIQYFSLILPIYTQPTEFHFYFDSNNYSFNTVEVFYLDRLPNIEPYKIMFY